VPLPPATRESFGVVVRNGLVLDGLGSAARRADVGIRDGKIAFVGDLSRARWEVEVDARGLHVCPGFIDLHSHADETCFMYPAVESAVRQGVTTVVVGQDGFSLAPLLPADSAKRNVELGFSEDWTTFAGYQAALERHPPSINVASFVGQGTLRRRVMGERPGPASPRELDAMRALADEALRAGAFGISSGLEYPPSANARREELAELCRVLAPMRGIYMTHMRNEDDTLLESIEEAIAIARQSGARLHVSHLKASGQRNWPKMNKALALLEAARDVSATADCYPYVAYFTTLQNLFPPSARAAGTKPFLDALRRPETAKTLRAAAEAKVAMLGSWDAVMLTGLRGTPRQTWDGRRVGELATSLARPPIDVVVDLLVERDGSVGMLGFGMSEENVARTLAHDLVAVASDGTALATTGPLSERKTHPRTYGTFPRVLARLVRERAALSLPQAIRKMTSMSAQILGLRDRGSIAVGAAADLVVFDPASVEDRSTFDDVHQYPVGIAKVMVNGELVIDDGRHTGARKGLALRRPA
jgi:N-acyl-D-amino-acid deacylase